MSIEQALQALEREGRLTASDVVQAAEDPESPLHAHFEWDNNIAAQAWRLEQARALIRSVRIVSKTIEHGITRTIAYVRDPECEQDQQGYVHTSRLRSQRDLAVEAAINELQRAEAAMSRAREVAQALGVEKMLDAAKAQVKNVQARMKATV